MNHPDDEILKAYRRRQQAQLIRTVIFALLASAGLYLGYLFAGAAGTARGTYYPGQHWEGTPAVALQAPRLVVTP